MTEKESLAAALWEAGALAPGEGETPIRWNGAAALADEGLRETLLDALEALAREHYAAARALLGGTWAELLSRRLGLPLAPDPLPERVLLVTDAVTDGRDLHALAAPLRASGKGIAAAALFSFGFPSARRLLDRADVRLHWLTDLETAAAVALQSGALDLEAYERLTAIFDDTGSEPYG